MLEKDVSQLDQDFITLWSDYFLNDFDYKNIKEEIRILAEKGHPKAIHAWYLFSNHGDNYIIDNNIWNLMYNPDPTYDELWAISTYLGNDERNNKGRKDIEYDIKDLMNRYFHNTNIGVSHQVIYYRKLIQKYPSYGYRVNAIKCIKEKDINENPSNILLLQRKLEMEYGNSLSLIFKGATDPKEYYDFQYEVYSVRRKLLKAYKIDPSNDVVKYHLAKNIKLLSEVIDTSKKHLNLADDIFKELSNRPLSIKQGTRR